MALTASDKRGLLHLHNYYRNQFALGLAVLQDDKQVKETNILQLVWDDALACAAQAYVNTDFSEDYHYIENNMNMAMVYGEGYTPVDFKKYLVDQWEEEGALGVTSAMISSYPSAFSWASEYTQIVWASATKVGCGYVESVDNANNYFHELVCVYDQGNVIGKPVAAATGCPTGSKANGSGAYPNLCGQSALSTSSTILTAAWPAWIPTNLKNPATRFLDEYDLYDTAEDIDVHFGTKSLKN